MNNRECTLKTKEIADRLIPLMEKCGCDTCKQLLELKQFMVKKSQWIFGGDGWGYDIGFGGLDHVLASGEDVNVVVDTEVYSCQRLRTPYKVKSNEVSNTGGQSSKATPAGAVAKFATSGKKIRKTVAQSESRGILLTMPSQSNVTESKDLGMIAKSYGYVYVAQVAMGASQAQYFCRRLRTPLKSKSNEVSNVIKEAEAYHGPSLSLRPNPKSGDFSELGSQVHWTCSYATPLQSAEGREHRLNQSDEVSNHGIKIGMGRTQWQRLRAPLNISNAVSNEEKMAVECGYSLFSADAIEAPLELLHLWHFNPAEEEAGQNGFHLDSAEPDWSKFRDFLMGEVRYNSLMKTFPQEAEELFVATENFAKQRYEGYKKLAE